MLGARLFINGRYIGYSSKVLSIKSHNGVDTMEIELLDGRNFEDFCYCGALKVLIMDNRTSYELDPGYLEKCSKNGHSFTLAFSNIEAECICPRCSSGLKVRGK